MNSFVRWIESIGGEQKNNAPVGAQNPFQVGRLLKGVNQNDWASKYPQRWGIKPNNNLTHQAGTHGKTE